MFSPSPEPSTTANCKNFQNWRTQMGTPVFQPFTAYIMIPCGENSRKGGDFL
jgi:hypothetical protein